ncbi:MAG: hypothetical protein ACXAEX_12815 [Promethearchaeota archaeon]
MLFLTWEELAIYTPFFIAGGLLVGGIFLLKLGLVITKAESKTNFKWVAISFLLQYGITLFLSSPILLGMILEMAGGPPFDYEPDPAFIAIAIIFSIILVINITNIIHKPGLKRSIIVGLLIFGPIVGSNFLIFQNIGIFIYG